MTDLLTRPRSLTPPPVQAPRRPLWLTCAAAGALAAGGVLVGCLALALVGWFSSEAGAFGDTRDALRVGAGGWLMAHGSGLRLGQTSVGILPLGLTALCAYVTFRLGRAATRGREGDDLRTTALGALVLASVYTLVATLTAVAATTPSAAFSPGRSLLGALLLSLTAGGAGVLGGTTAGRALLGRVPGPATAILRTALAVSCAVLLAGAVLVATALLLDLGAAATVLSRLHADTAGGALATLLVAAFAPNAVLMGGAYLLGPGFAVGTGTIVSSTSVVLGPVPAFPLLAALPPDGPTPGWLVWLVGVPVLLAAVAAALVVRGALGRPDAGYQAALLRGLAGGALAGLVCTVLVWSAGGAVGPGRMADVGASTMQMLASAPAGLALGAAVGAVLRTGWSRYRQRRAAATVPAPGGQSADADSTESAESAESAEDTVIL